MTETPRPDEWANVLPHMATAIAPSVMVYRKDEVDHARAAVEARHQQEKDAAWNAVHVRDQALLEAQDRLSTLEADFARVTQERDEARALNEFFRDSVGECHVMISRKTAAYQIRREWNPEDLPPRLQKVMEAKQAAEAEVTTLRTALGRAKKIRAAAERVVAAHAPDPRWMESAHWTNLRVALGKDQD